MQVFRGVGHCRCGDEGAGDAACQPDLLHRVIVIFASSSIDIFAHRVIGMYIGLFLGSIVAEEQASAGQNPLVGVGVLALHVEVGSEDESGASQGRVVDWTVVLSQDLLVLQQHRHDVYHWQFRVQFLWLLLHQVSVLAGRSQLPSGSFQHKAVDICSVFGWACDFLGALEQCHIGLEGHVIKGQNLFSGGVLHDGGQERHGIEEVGDEERLGGDKVAGPLLQLGTSLDEFVEPHGEVLLGRIGIAFPGAGHFVECEGPAETLHGVSDVEGTGEAQTQVFEGLLDFAQEGVHSLALLEADHNVGGLFLDFSGDVEHGVLGGGPVLEVDNEIHDIVTGASPGARASCDRQDGVENGVALGGQVADFRIGVHTEHLGDFSRQLLLDVLLVGLVVVFGGVGRLEQVVEQVEVGQQQLRLEQHLQVSGVGPAVPIVCDVAAVHDLTENVLQVVPWHHIVLAQIVVQHVGADCQVTVVEVVYSTPALAAELLAPDHQRVEVTQGEQAGLELVELLVAFVQECLAEVVVGSPQVGFQELRGFVGDLDGLLQDGLRDDFHVGQGWGL